MCLSDYTGLLSCVQVRTKDYHVFLADFGLSRIISSTKILGTRTLMAGTPAFQAPEQLKVDAVNEGADIYAFGILLIELFGEKAVWEQLTPYQVIVKVVLEGATPDFNHLPLQLQRICARCLKAKEDRDDIHTILKALLSIDLSN